MLVGLRKTSLVDYPGRVAAVLFMPGCSLRCPWCHNRELVLGGQDGAAEGLFGEDEILAFLDKRVRLLGGVVLSGGEPLLNPASLRLAEEIKRRGYPLKVDTNGMHPERLEELVGNPATRPDYLALDIKTLPERYDELLHLSPKEANAAAQGGAKSGPGAALRRSMACIAESNIDFEYRSLAIPGFFGAQELRAIAPILEPGIPWRISGFRPGNCLNPAWDEVPETSEAELRSLVELESALRKNPLRRNAHPSRASSRPSS